MNPDLDQAIRKHLGLGAVEIGGKIYHAKDPRLPQFSFEWHTHQQKAYRIDLPGEWTDGQWVPAPPGSQARGLCIAEHCMTHAMFLGFVQTFCRAYLLASVHQTQGKLQTLSPNHTNLGVDPCPER